RRISMSSFFPRWSTTSRPQGVRSICRSHRRRSSGGRNWRHKSNVFKRRKINCLNFIGLMF
ncbi:hypothetical protein FRB90_009008, partial [Tulasnella sp. 427]